MLTSGCAIKKFFSTVFIVISASFLFAQTMLFSAVMNSMKKNFDFT